MTRFLASLIGLLIALFLAGYTASAYLGDPSMYLTGTALAQVLNFDTLDANMDGEISFEELPLT